MALVIALSACVVAVLSVLAVVWVTDRRGRDRLVTEHLRSRYMVTLKSGEAFEAVLSDADSKSLVLVQAKSVAAGREPIAVDGSLIVFRSDVAYLQRP